MARLGEVTMRPILAAVLSACLAASALPPGAAAAQTVDARYSVQTMGVDMGRATLQVDRATDGVTTRFRFENDALLGFVEASDLQMRSVVAPGRGKVLPKLFEGNYNKDDRVREVDLAYGAGGAIDGYQLIKRGRVRVDAVPQGLATGTLDPLAALLQIRAWLDQAPEGAELAIPVFDGRKRYDATLRYLGLTQVASAGGTAPAHTIALRYRLVASLDEDTGKFAPEPAARLREMQLAVSADGRYVPLRLDGSLDGLPITAVIEGDCAGPSGCAN
jgi:Protein of unknown function (DUF3108)